MLNDPTCSSPDIALYFVSMILKNADNQFFEELVIDQVEWHEDGAWSAKWDAAQELNVFTIKVRLPTGSFVDVPMFFNQAMAEFKKRLEKHEAMTEFKESYDLYYALSGNRLDVDTIPKGVVIEVRSA